MRDVTKLFGKLLLVLLAALLILTLLNRVYVNGYYYSDVYGEVEKFRDVPYGITMANFGTSHGLAGFRYPEEETHSFNFALSGEDLYHDFQTLKQFADHMEEGCVVALPISFFSFCLSTDEPSQKRYYCYLDKKYIHGFSYETWINVKYLPVLRSIEFLFKDLIGDQEINIERFMDDGDVELNVEEVKLNEEGIVPVVTAAESQASSDKDAQLRSHAATRSESWRSGRMVLGKPNMEANTELLIEMIRFCKEHGFRPVLLTVPVYHALREDFSEEELRLYYYSNIDRVVEKTGIPYIDYSVDEAFIYDTSYYGNSDHMSAAGSNAFYRAFREDLEELGYHVIEGTEG